VQGLFCGSLYLKSIYYYINIFKNSLVYIHERSPFPIIRIHSQVLRRSIVEKDLFAVACHYNRKISFFRNSETTAPWAPFKPPSPHCANYSFGFVPKCLLAFAQIIFSILTQKMSSKDVCKWCDGVVKTQYRSNAVHRTGENFCQPWGWSIRDLLYLCLFN